MQIKMKKYIVFTALFLFVAVAQAQIDRSKQPKPGPAPEINLQEPVSFQLKNGLKVLVVENHKLPRVSIQLTIDNPPILEGEKAGVSSLTGALIGNGSTLSPKMILMRKWIFLGPASILGHKVLLQVVCPNIFQGF